ncbi:hypothetical protein DXG01_008099 [Tephrocybe rancida]|nr:hypothetical protein DXG01_008099 [Tephrocybe rancida]
MTFSTHTTPQLDHSQTDVNLAAVIDFFQSSLPTLVPAPNDEHTKSKNTRPPAQFDKHLHPELTLKRVIYCPSMVKDFAAIANNALSQYVSHRPLPSTERTLNEDGVDTNDFPGNGSRDDSIHDIEIVINKIVNEESVRDIYAATLVPQCLTVASTLAFHLPLWSRGYLEWEKTTYTDENFGIADGFFKCVNRPAKSACGLVPPLSALSRKMMEYFPNLAVWEFKNLLAGSLGVFEGIRELARNDQFQWTGCEAGHLCGVIKKNHPTSGSDKPLVYWEKLGPDAPNPVCKSTTEKPVPAADIPPISSKGCASANALHSIHITQQVWAEMVKHDTTFACLSSGHLKMYFYRRRREAWLYTSDVISTDMAGTSGLLTGFLIAILHDAQERTLELERTKPTTWCDANPYAIPPDDVPLVPKKNTNPSGSFIQDRLYRRVSLHSTEITREPAIGDPFLHVAIDGERHTSKGTFKVNDIVFPGILGQFSKFICVKTANADSTLERRKKEYSVILDLQAAGVTCIPDLLGFFVYVDPDYKVKLTYAAVIFEDVGDISLQDIWDNTQKIDEIYRAAAKEGLKQIHDAGYCHRDISLCDIIVRKPKRSDRQLVSFVNLVRAKKVGDDQKYKMKQEKELLAHLLVNPRKRWGDGLQKGGETVQGDIGLEERLEVMNNKIQHNSTTRGRGGRSGGTGGMARGSGRGSTGGGGKRGAVTRGSVPGNVDDNYIGFRVDML